MPIEEILAGLDEFYERLRLAQETSDRLGLSEHSPDVLLVSCSDARMPVDLLTQLDPGALFVTRNVANIVPPYGGSDMGLGAAIEFVVLSLGVKHVVVLGHTDCGGIKALDETPDWRHAPHLARWIEHARPARTKVEASGLPEGERHLATVRENVLLQLEHLRSYDPIREGLRAGTLTLHGWVYRLETASLEAYDPAAGSWKPLSATP